MGNRVDRREQGWSSVAGAKVRKGFGRPDWNGMRTSTSMISVLVMLLCCVCMKDLYSDWVDL